MYDRILLISNLGDVLSQVENLSKSEDEACGLFVLNSDEKLDHNTLAAIIVGDKYDDITEVSDAVAEKKLFYLLELQTVQSVIRHLKWEKKDVAVWDMVRALTYFLENDAYMDLTHG